MSARPSQKTPRILVDVLEAATALDVSEALFRKEVLPELATVAIGTRRLVPVEELHRWVETRKATGCAVHARVRHTLSASGSTGDATSTALARQIAQRLTERVEQSTRTRSQGGATVVRLHGSKRRRSANG